MALYALGDALLQFVLTEAFGVVAFAVGHAVFTAFLLLRHRIKRVLSGAVAAAAVLACSSGLACMLASAPLSALVCVRVPGPGMVPLVLGYSGVLASAVASSAACLGLLGTVGCVLFAVSDLILIMNESCLVIDEPLRSLLVMPLYWLGCISMTISATPPSVHARKMN
jgi:hypothetical protein